ncbi:glycosyltransferase family protein [Sphingobium phenoxybenzoativorans]|uniref:glycosyltransferase family protein n=1 Tax=Sphingobium phenoxybenzoativorans TaxID=1592790 RepID=UPI00087245C1|nr:glycosyltransferase [Sphingobium phenoxybenzoativorans]
MSEPKSAVFVINLLQDLNILRPLIVMATRDFRFATTLLISARFGGRDIYGIWQAEIDQLCGETGASQIIFQDELTAFKTLTGKSGLIFAASESDLSAHAITHNVLRYAPAEFLRVTLQHGFECVGFRHSDDHIRAYGTTISFGADIVCAWYDGPGLTAMSPSQRNKLHVTGPTAVLQTPTGHISKADDAPGLICENLHSVRLNIAGDFKTQFVDTFEDFCKQLAKEQRTVTLRPHPGGQYMLKNNVALPANATINNAPMYKLDLRQFGYGISAPSSVLIDMLLADIPTAVWKDGEGVMDSAAYDGLTEISSAGEWMEFSREAISRPDHFRDLQKRFLERQQMPIDPAEVYSRFAKLFQTARRLPQAVRQKPSTERQERVFFVANAYIPTLQLSFVKPLTSLVESGAFATEYLTEQMMREKRAAEPAVDMDAWVSDSLDRFDPSIVIFCRYSGPHYKAILDWASDNGVPVIYHVDDDLLKIPRELGEEKYKFHNDPKRLESVLTSMNGADIVYCSTKNLRERFSSRLEHSNLVTGQIYCSSSILNSSENRPTRTVGYMGFDHAHDLELVLPALVEFLRRNRHVQFELFGSIPKPAVLDEFGDRIVTIPPVRDYAEFLKLFAARNWDIGICPLAHTEFNLVKANTKWVEYSASGIAVIASAGTVYDDCCSDGCGVLAQTDEDWLEALTLLANDADERFAQVARAQQKIAEHYSVDALREQVLGIIHQARIAASKRP